MELTSWTRIASPATIKKATGKVKEVAGRAVGDRHTEAEGSAEQAEGRVREGQGQAKDAVRELVGKK